MKSKIGSIIAGLCVLLLVSTLYIGVPNAGAATQSAIDDAIQKGLAWLAAHQNPNGSFYGGYPLSSAAAAVLAFENEGYFPGPDSSIPSTPGTYSRVVEDGLDYMFQYAYKISIGPQWAGDPDTNGNGQGIYFQQSSPVYETGMVMQAIVASNTPSRIVTIGPCSGMTYEDVLTDMVDWAAWAQIDGYTGRGGWRYGFYDNTDAIGDNSVSQWPVLGLVAAEQWGIYAPEWVKDELNIWIDYIQNDSNGGSGYDAPNSIVNISKTGGLLVEMYYVGDDKDTPRALAALDYINLYWAETPGGTWYGNKGHPYAMFSVFKGLELMEVTTIPNALPSPDTPAGDWWGDYCEYL